MIDLKQPRTGIIKYNDIPFNIYINDYKVTFMDNREEHPFFYLKSDEKFLFGKLHNGKSIAIDFNDISVPIYGSGALRNASYIISDATCDEMKTFKNICFKGGTLKKLFMRNSIEEDRTAYDGKITYNYKDDTLQFTFSTKYGVCNASISSGIRQSWSLYDGTNLSNEDVTLTLYFDEYQSLDSIYTHIDKIRTLISFMSYRKEVCFDEIIINHGGIMKDSQVFMPQNEYLTSKTLYNCITFNDLNTSTGKLLEILYDDTRGKPTYELGFIPETDKDSDAINSSQIRTICSAIECELSFVADIVSDEAELIEKLKNEVKKVIKAHRDSEQPLKSKTYDMIFGNIKHWSMAVSDKIYALYERYEQEMLIINPSDFHIVDEDIHNFIKYRNNITHGNFSVIDPRIVITAYILAGLVYCCLLARIGIEREKIVELCRRNFLI